MHERIQRAADNRNALNREYAMEALDPCYRNTLPILKRVACRATDEVIGYCSVDLTYIRYTEGGSVINSHG